MSNKLENKIALVTGAGRGIGQAIATKLASEGANLVINDLTEEPALETKKIIEDITLEKRLWHMLSGLLMWMGMELKE